MATPGLKASRHTPFSTIRAKVVEGSEHTFDNFFDPGFSRIRAQLLPVWPPRYFSIPLTWRVDDGERDLGKRR